MTLKQLMSINNCNYLIKTLSYEGADDLLRVHIRHLDNETAALRKNLNEAMALLEYGTGSLNLDYAEVELDEFQTALKEKMHQLNHIRSLLDDLSQQDVTVED